MTAGCAYLLLVVLSAPPATLCTEAGPLQAGTPAPCTGILWPEDWSLQALSCGRVVVPQLEAKLKLCASEQKSCTAHLSDLRAICEKSVKRLGDLTADALDINANPPFWEGPIFWGVVGFVIGGATMYSAFSLAK